MNIKRFNRVELLLPRDKLQPAIDTFSSLLGIPIEPPVLVEGGITWSTAAWEAALEFIAPGSEHSPLQSLLERQKGWGAIGPVVWEVEDLESVLSTAREMGIGIIYEFDLGNGGRQVYLDTDACFGYTLAFLDKPLAAHEPAPGSGALFTRFNRLELLMPPEQLEKARVFLSRLLDIDIEPLEYLADHHVLTTTHWGAGIELFGPGDEHSELNQLLASKGDLGAIGPLVWEVEDLEAFKAHALSLGHGLIYEFEMPDRKQMCLADTTLFGYTATFTQLLSAP